MFLCIPSGRRGDKSQVRTLHRARFVERLFDVVDLRWCEFGEAEEVVAAFVSNAENNS